MYPDVFRRLSVTAVLALLVAVGAPVAGSAPPLAASAATTAATATATALPRFAATTHGIGPSNLARMRYSHRAGCPVATRDLRLVRMVYYGFDKRAHTGEMVVHRLSVGSTIRTFKKLYDARFPIQRMVLVDVYGGSDDRSMAANNTSAYNCRKATGSTRWSEHSYGRAIDINPVQNPYVKGSYVAPTAGEAFLSRSTYRTGMIRTNDVVVRSFAAERWGWGGSWRYSKDYQHFSLSGR